MNPNKDSFIKSHVINIDYIISICGYRTFQLSFDVRIYLKDRSTVT